MVLAVRKNQQKGFIRHTSGEREKNKHKDKDTLLISLEICQTRTRPGRGLLGGQEPGPERESPADGRTMTRITTKQNDDSSG